jgi:hypothetical protein
MSSGMYPCFLCDRHLREFDRLCPFCGAVQSTVPSPSLGALALTVALLGSTACARDPGSADATAGTTTSMSSTTISATDSEESSGATSSTSGDGDGDMTNTTNNGSVSFYAGAEPDWGWAGQCDPFIQDCPEGEKCVPYASTGEVFDANKCVPVTGDGQPGDPCVYGGIVESSDNCGQNSFCWAEDDAGVCTEFCQGNPDDPSCPMGLECLIANQTTLNLCIASCHPLLQDCEPGFACYFSLDVFNCSATTEDIALGDPCDAVNDCAFGLACLPADVMPDCAGDSCCASYCDLMMPTCPQMGTECAAFFDGVAPPGYENVGLCVLPG